MYSRSKIARLNLETLRSHVELSCATDAGGLIGFVVDATGARPGAAEA